MKSEFVFTGSFESPAYMLVLHEKGQVTMTVPKSESDEIGDWRDYFTGETWKIHCKGPSPLAAVFSGAYTSTEHGFYPEEKKRYETMLKDLQSRGPTTTGIFEANG